MQKMSKHSWCGSLVLVIALWWAAPIPVHAAPFTPAVEYATETFFVTSAGTAGYQFSTSIPLTIDALASWDMTHLGDFVNPDAIQVGLWDSGGTLLVSATVLNTDPIQNHFQFHSISPMTLVPGEYTIGSDTANQLVPVQILGAVTVPGFIWSKAVFDINPGLNLPTMEGVYGQNGILAANFSITSASAVPEPSSLILLGSALVGLAAWRRKHSA